MKLTLEQLFIIINTLLVVILFYLNKRSGRTSVLPYLHIELSNGARNPLLTIANQGDVFAMDVDIYTIGYISLDDELGASDKAELSKLVKDFSILPTPDDEGWIGIRDRLMYSVFPKRKVVAPLAIPEFVDQIVIIVQYRDPTGINYGQSYWYTQSGDRYSLEELHQRKLKTSFRREYLSAMKSDFETIRKVSLRRLFSRYFYWSIWNKIIVFIRPGYLDEHEHRILMNHSISAGTLKTKGANLSFYPLSDRGHWEDL